jgi:hypothetical protein
MKPLNFLLVVIVMFSHTARAQWTNTGGPQSRAIQCFTIADSNIIAGTDGGLVRSTSHGINWQNIGGGMPYPNTRALLSVTSYPFTTLAGMVSGRISMSSNFGTNWTGFPLDSVQTPGLAHINSIIKNNSEFWVGTERGVFLLPQYYPLSSWIPLYNGLPSGEFTPVRAMLERNGEIFAGANGGVYKWGTTWVPKNAGLTNTNVTVLANAGNYMIAGTSQGSIGGVYLSSDNGENWALSKPDSWVTSILVVGSTIFVGSFGDGVWRSTNFGSTWGQINDGFAGAAYYVLSLAADNQYIFAGTNNANVWRRPLSQVTGVKSQAGSHPEEFSLHQNYPNPFNPSTTINYDLPKESRVSLKVFDTLGREVATLVNEDQKAGYKSTVWNGAGLASGIYYYRLQAGDFTATRKLLLLK